MLTVACALRVVVEVGSYVKGPNMNPITLSPYLFFQGNCAEAMEFYKGIFGGELTVQKISSVPADSRPAGMSEDLVMHASLNGGAASIMGSDSPLASAKAAKVELSLSCEDEPQMRAIFEQLGDGGKVRIPLVKQFWGDIFGAVTDKFNVDWMVNIPVKKG